MLMDENTAYRRVALLTPGSREYGVACMMSTNSTKFTAKSERVLARLKRKRKRHRAVVNIMLIAALNDEQGLITIIWDSLSIGARTYLGTCPSLG